MTHTFERRTLQAILWTWHELPSLLGPDWGEIFPRCRDLLRRIEAAKDSKERASLTLDLIQLLAAYPSARRRLKEVRDRLGSDRVERGNGEPGVKEPPPAWDALGGGIERRLDPPAVTRYTDIGAPARLTRGSRGAITVGLSRTPRAESVFAERLELAPDPPVEVHCHAAAEDFEVLGEPVRGLKVERDADTEPLAFRIRALRLGRRPVWLDFRQSGSPVGSVRVEIEVVSQDVAADEQRTVAGQVALGGAYAPLPDLELRVIYASDPPTLRYVLHSPNGSVEVHHVGSSPVPLAAPAPRYFQHLLERSNRSRRAWTPKGSSSSLRR